MTSQKIFGVINLRRPQKSQNFRTLLLLYKYLILVLSSPLDVFNWHSAPLGNQVLGFSWKTLSLRSIYRYIGLFFLIHTKFTILIRIIKLTGKRTCFNQANFYEKANIASVSPLQNYKLNTNKVSGWKKRNRSTTIVRKLDIGWKKKIICF